METKMFIKALQAGPKRIAAGGGPAELLPTAHLLNSTSDWKSSKNQAVNPLLLPAGKLYVWALSKKQKTHLKTHHLGTKASFMESSVS